MVNPEQTEANMHTVPATDVAFESFLSCFARELSRYFARRKAREPEDLAQSVAALLWARRSTYDAAKGTLHVWGYTVARREFARTFRRELASPLVLAPGAIDPDAVEEKVFAADWTITDPVVAISVARGEEIAVVRKFPRKAAAKRRSPAELAIVARVRSMRDEGRTYGDIERRLRREGVVSRRGRPYALSSIVQMEASL